MTGESGESRTATGLGSGGRYSDPDEPICAGCEQPIAAGEAVWEVGAQWHPGCLPPSLAQENINTNEEAT